MAKKVVATLKDKKKVQLTKVVVPFKSKTGSYSYRETMIPQDQVKDFVKEGGK